MRLKIEFDLDSTVIAQLADAMGLDKDADYNASDMIKGVAMAVSMKEIYRTDDLVRFVKHWVDHPYKS